MFYVYIMSIICVVYIFCDVNYLIRTCFTVLSGRICQKRYSLNDTTTIYGMCTFQDCDIMFQSMRLSRLVRELDFARYHFYDQTGIYRRSQQLSIKSLQGSTLMQSFKPIPLFARYKILTKLVYWDKRSLFFEHEVVTLHDDTVRCVLVSRQFAIGLDKESTTILLKDLPVSKSQLNYPEYIKLWLNSMKLSSEQLRIHRK